MRDFTNLFLATIIHRPYVYGFFLCFLLFSLSHLRWRATFIFVFIAFLTAFICEYSSTRIGFPFGYYVYFDDSRSRELWISNVPFWDSLSFVFLSYFSWILAASLITPVRPHDSLLRYSTAPLAGVLMMLLDIVIDPVTLLGDQWFLGRIYEYPNGGFYFGVPLSNFLGWFFLGTTIVFLFQSLAKSTTLPRCVLTTDRWRNLTRRDTQLCFGIYAGIFLFNLTVTLWIGRWDILLASFIVTIGTLGTMGLLLSKRRESILQRVSYLTLPRASSS